MQYVRSTQSHTSRYELRQYSRCRPGIDQTNVNERNHQVGLMDLIYTNARAVYSCIDHASNFRNLFHWLQGGILQNYATSPALADLDSLFSLRYFNRVWVIQEVALARIAYLVVNHDILPLTALVIGRMKKAYASGPKAKHDNELPSVLRWSLGHKTRLGIVSCLHTSRSCHATDPRDYIYAVMGLMEDKARSLIPVDYSLDLEVVYRHVIVAIIATRQNLEILLFSGIGHLHPGADWRTAQCLNMAAFRCYFGSITGDSQDQSSGQLYWPSRYYRHCLGLWRKTISVDIQSPSKYRSVFEYAHASCLIEIPQSTLFGLLPRLCVRAHYIDSINIGHEDVTIERLPTRKMKETDDAWILDCFKAEAPPHDGLLPTEYSDVHLEDLRCFLEMGASHPSWCVFSSHFSVGYKHQVVQTAVADEIFAIDGTDVLFVLRKTEGLQYRVVGPCYLWAARELDCWNPGSKKGRWGPGLIRPTIERTRMIEIY